MDNNMQRNDAVYARTELLVGENAMMALRSSKVIIFGVGGVGSWCAESLLRSGIEHLTLVDSDVVCASNLNRQLMATTQTIGQPKVQVLRERLMAINPAAHIQALQQIYSEETAANFHLEEYDCVVDAIDSLENKAHLILHATQLGLHLVSSMGAALKMDPTRVKVAEFWKVTGCPLARALRNKFKKRKTMPRHKFPCVYSDELLKNQGVAEHAGTDGWSDTKAQTNGTIAHITAIFGFMLAGLVVKHVLNISNNNNHRQWEETNTHNGSLTK